MPESSSSQLFPNTDWSLVHLLNSPDAAQADIALNRLCLAYYRPLYVCARASGLSAHDAEDAVQDFMAHLLGNDAFKALNQEKGRLRAWIGRGFSNRLIYRYRNQSALKRGGGCEHLSLDFAHAEHLYQHDHRHDDSAEHACDLRTALDLWIQVLRRLDADPRLNKRPEIYAALRPCILSGWPSNGPSQTEVGAQLGLSASTLRVRLHNLAIKARAHFDEVARANLDPLIPSEDLDHLWQLLKAT
jgi:RNA polymerase sigma-70 factor (ECF subfamily)